MKIGELAERLGIPYRQVRYVLEEGILPEGVTLKPGRGEHRVLSLSQAFWLGYVLILKNSGLKSSLAREVAVLSNRGVRGFSRLSAWDYYFDPFAGQLVTEHRWYVDIGDLKYIRVATTASPSHGGRLIEDDWTEIALLRAAKTAKPLVTLRVDVSQLAKLLLKE